MVLETGVEILSLVGWGASALAHYFVEHLPGPDPYASTPSSFNINSRFLKDLFFVCTSWPVKNVDGIVSKYLAGFSKTRIVNGESN